MDILDNGPLEDFEVTYSNDVDEPYIPNVILIFEDDVVAWLDPAKARRLAYRILDAVESGAIEQESKHRDDLMRKIRNRLTP